MPSVVPSQIVQYIDGSPLLSFFVRPTNLNGALNAATCGALKALLRLIDQLPNTLLPSQPEIYPLFIQTTEQIRFAVDLAQRNSHITLPSDGPNRPSLVRIVRDALSACPDEVPPSHSTELQFIRDREFRTALLVDLEATRSALQNGEWKAATVLGGSLVEAILLWAILEKPTESEAAFVALQAVGKLNKNKNASYKPLEWGLHEFVEIAEQAKLIAPGTAKQTRLAKDFRNLIHPGRIIRENQACDRGTALGTSAAVELVSRDLKARLS